MHQEFNLSESRLRLAREHSEVRKSIRNTRTFNTIGGLATGGSMVTGIYEIGVNINRGSNLIALGVVAGTATALGMLHLDGLHRREDGLTQRALNFEADIE